MSQDEVGGPVTVPEFDWRKLDPKMLLVYPVSEFGRLAIPLLVLIFLGGNGPDLWHSLVVIVPVTIGVWRYASTEFRITEEHVELRHGLVGTHVTRARLDKVRTVALDASPIHRILGLFKVRIGTGDDEGLELNALPTAEARALRTALLHTVVTAPGSTADRRPEAMDDVVLRFDPRWLLLAPFTSTGIVIAASAVAAALGPFLQPTQRVWEQVQDRTSGIPVAALWVAGAFLLGLVMIALSVAGYALRNWGFTFSRDRDGRSWHLRQGLLSTKETSVEVARVRGVSVHRALGLRVVGGGSARVLVTGLRSDESRGSAEVVPAAPYRVVDGFCREVFGDVDALTAPLVQHGRRARRRQVLRPVRGVLVPAAAVAFAAGFGAVPWWVTPVALALVPIAVLVGLDRYRGLGHLLTVHHLVAGSPRVNRQRHLLLRQGIIGWKVQQSWFQRRARLVTLVATTAAGNKNYAIVDVAEDLGTALADRAVPGLVAQFLR